MAMKPFEIQGADLKLGGVTLQAGTTGVVIPGVTRAASYKVEEVEEVDDQTQTIENSPLVIDAVMYNALIANNSADLSGYATYTVDLKNNQYIDEIEIDSDNDSGTYTQQEANVNKITNMWAYGGSNSANAFSPFVSADWFQIPFRPKMRAGEVELENGGGGGSTTEITNTDGSNTYSVSVGTNGVVSMNTARGGIEFGAQPEEGAPQHLHIMRSVGQEGSTDLYFGDDYNYVKMPSSSYSQQGVEIGSSLNQGTVSTWRFGTDGHLILPAGGDIKDITGTSVLGGGGGGGGNTNTGDITFSGGYMTGTDGEIRMRTLNLQQTASYNFTPGNSDYSTAVWDGTGITFNDPTQSIYDAIWALTGFSTIEVQVGGNWFTVTSSGSSTPGMPQAPTLFVNESAVDGPLNIDVVDIVINQGTSSYVEIDGTDFRVDVQDDIRIYGNDTFILYNRSTSDPIRIQTNDGDNTWGFEPDGSLTLPDYGDIIRNGTSVIPSLATVATTGNYTDLSDRPSLLYRQVYAPATSTGQSGDLMHDIAFGGDYVYYCTQNYNSGYQVTLASGYSGGPYPYLLKGDYPQPQPGWTFVWETVTYAIVTVTDPNVGEWQLELDQTIDTGAGGIITLVPPAVDIWKRVAFSVDTW